jgi:hypothetical protein
MLMAGLSVAPGPPPGHGPGSEEAGNNLSYPAVYTTGAAESFLWAVPVDPVFAEDFSYGCDLPEVIEQYSYPNTSCTNDDGATFLTAAECVLPGNPCDAFTAEQLQRIYWQKEADVRWNADTVLITPPVYAAYLDWSDNLETTTWSVASSVRVETQPYADVVVDYLLPTMTGFQMWHVSGHGPTEHWGARVTDVSQQPPLAPYLYETNFGIIHTSTARLNLAKLEPADAECPTAENPGTPPFLPGELDWDGNSWVNPDGTDPCTWQDLPQTVELNVGGKWVYGYNWMTRRMTLPASCDDFVTPGWWRLTFYTTDGSVLFDVAKVIALDPPAASDAFPTVFESETGAKLYPPEIDYDYNVTYIDICLEPRGGGGGGSGGGGHGGGGGH